MTSSSVVIDEDARTRRLSADDNLLSISIILSSILLTFANIISWLLRIFFRSSLSVGVLGSWDSRVRSRSFCEKMANNEIAVSNNLLFSCVLCDVNVTAGSDDGDSIARSDSDGELDVMD